MPGLYVITELNGAAKSTVGLDNLSSMSKRKNFQLGLLNIFRQLLNYFRGSNVGLVDSKSTLSPYDTHFDYYTESRRIARS